MFTEPPKTANLQLIESMIISDRGTDDAWVVCRAHTANASTVAMGDGPISDSTLLAKGPIGAVHLGPQRGFSAAPFDVMTGRGNHVRAQLPHCSFLHVRTRDVPADTQFDFWRSQCVAPRIERPHHADPQCGFEGEMVKGTWVDGIWFASVQVDPVVGRFGEQERPVIVLCCVRDQAGTLEVRSRRGQSTLVHASSGIMLLDCNQTFTTCCSRLALDYIGLPRALATLVLGNPLARASETIRVLPRGALARSLRQHLARLGTDGESLSAARSDEAMRAARALAVTLLARLDPHWRRLPGGFETDVLTAARFRLQEYADDPELTAERLARTLGCSRAHLYRLFAHEGKSIHDELRELRLQRARALLEGTPEQPIVEIAIACGYADVAAFTRAFRQRFGAAPRDWSMRTRPTFQGADAMPSPALRY